MSDEKRVTTSFSMKPSTHKRLKMEAWLKNTSISAVLEDLLGEMFEQRPLTTDQVVQYVQERMGTANMPHQS